MNFLIRNCFLKLVRLAAVCSISLTVGACATLSWARSVPNDYALNGQQGLVYGSFAMNDKSGDNNPDGVPIVGCGIVLKNVDSKNRLLFDCRVEKSK
jgi:hypothetical protein